MLRLARERDQPGGRRRPAWRADRRRAGRRRHRAGAAPPARCRPGGATPCPAPITWRRPAPPPGMAMRSTCWPRRWRRAPGCRARPQRGAAGRQRAYPTPAARPRNSRLDTRLFETTFGLRMPDWRDHVDRLVAELAADGPIMKCFVKATRFPMNAVPLAIPDVVLFEPRVFGDERGFFFESFHQRRFEDAIGREVRFVQDNHSKSAARVLRGLHYQLHQPQGKLIRVIAGQRVRRRRRYPPGLAQLRPVGRRSPQRGEQEAAVGAGRVRPRLPGALRVGRMPLQEHRLLRARTRALHCLERSGAGDRLAARRRAACCRQRTSRACRWPWRRSSPERRPSNWRRFPSLFPI